MPLAITDGLLFMEI